MVLGPARALAMSGVLAVAAAQVACVDHARCDAALEGVAEARAEGERRDRQLAWLSYWQVQLATELRGRAAIAGTDAEREALRRRVALLEAENAELAARLARLEQQRAEGGNEGGKPRADSPKRRLDPAVPYALLAKPAMSGKQEGSILRRATRPSRRLDPMVPYEAGHDGAVTQAPPPAAPPATRTLDEDVPY